MLCARHVGHSEGHYSHFRGSARQARLVFRPLPSCPTVVLFAELLYERVATNAF
jgi:hypothetical protein